MINTRLQLSFRSASPEDRRKLANLIHFEINVHRHLDWRAPLDWLGYQPYLLAEQNGSIVAALACPPDPPFVAWIRLFAVSSTLEVENAWDLLWSEARLRLREVKGLQWVAAIPLQNWFQELLERSRFVETHRVVMLGWERSRLPPAQLQSDFIVRPMTLDDLPVVTTVDKASFMPVWQNSQESLELAFRQAAVATVAERQERTVGYQISTATPLGGHLARLAVLPEVQGHGVGYALVRDMLSQFARRGAQSVTVNTQQNNEASLTLYKKSGFQLTGEAYPIFQFEPD